MGQWMRAVRDYLPWILAGSAIWLFSAFLIPDSFCRFRVLRAEVARLSTVAPQPEVLKERLEHARRDSVARSRLCDIALRRQANGSDPGSQVASLVVPRLESRGLKLARVQARQEKREVLLSLSFQTTWPELLAGFASLDSLPLAWTSRRLVLKPADGYRLAGELVLGVPAVSGGRR